MSFVIRFLVFLAIQYNYNSSANNSFHIILFIFTQQLQCHKQITERGYTVIIMAYWLTGIILNCNFAINKAHNIRRAYISYMIVLYILVSVLTILDYDFCDKENITERIR